MEEGLSRFGVSMDNRLLEAFDRIIRVKGYANRSEAIRDLIRDCLVSEANTESENEGVGTVTLVYNHLVRELGPRLTELQHEYHHAVVSTLHVHLDNHYCLEVMVVKGKVGLIRKVADRLISTRGVIHGKLVITNIAKMATAEV